MELLKMKDICKSFSGVPVLKKVHLTVEKGEVHALLGENGAGKSTLMNVLTGVCPLDAGEIVFDGKRMENLTIRHMENAGISFVHQELNLFNDLKAYENIFLGREYTNRVGTLQAGRMHLLGVVEVLVVGGIWGSVLLYRTYKASRQALQ